MKKDPEEVTGEKAAILEEEAAGAEDMDEVVEGVMVAVEAEEEATVVAVAEVMTAVPIVDTIAAKTGTVDPHPSRKDKKSTSLSTLLENGETGLHESTTLWSLYQGPTKAIRSRSESSRLEATSQLEKS